MVQAEVKTMSLLAGRTFWYWFESNILLAVGRWPWGMSNMGILVDMSVIAKTRSMVGFLLWNYVHILFIYFDLLMREGDLDEPPLLI